MNIRLHDIIEHLALDRYKPTDNETAQILNLYSNHELIELSVDFLNGIGNRHNIEGNTIYTIASISRFYKETQTLTNKQRYYLFYNILHHWSNMSAESRDRLRL